MRVHCTPLVGSLCDLLSAHPTRSLLALGPKSPSQTLTPALYMHTKCSMYITAPHEPPLRPNFTDLGLLSTYQV